jgi:hypothetical protein
MGKGKASARPQRWVNSGVTREPPLRELDKEPAGKRAARIRGKQK